MNILKFCTSVPLRFSFEHIPPLSLLVGRRNVHQNPDQRRSGLFRRKSPSTPDGSISSELADLGIRPRPNVQSPEDAAESIRLQKIKRTLRFHMEKMEREGLTMKEKEAEFEIGRRHLANMMGADPNTFSQKDIDKSIEYLMPSGLFDPRARPQMKPPKELFPPLKGIQFDSTGRPMNMFFYTGRENLYMIFHNISSKLEELNKFEDQMIAKGISSPPPETAIFIDDSQWISLVELREILHDKKLPEAEYNYLIESLERLVGHPYSFRVKDFITKLRTPKLAYDLSSSNFSPLTVGDDGVPYATALGSRKLTRAKVTVKGKGTGEIVINGMDISFFPLKQDREQLLFPLKFSGLLNQVDIEATITGPGGHSAEAGALRHGIALALGSFVPPEMASKMRLAGLITRDIRKRERKKPGQRGARAKFKWVKR